MLHIHPVNDEFNMLTYREDRIFSTKFTNKKTAINVAVKIVKENKAVVVVHGTNYVEHVYSFN